MFWTVGGIPLPRQGELMRTKECHFHLRQDVNKTIKTFFSSFLFSEILCPSNTICVISPEDKIVEVELLVDGAEIPAVIGLHFCTV